MSRRSDLARYLASRLALAPVMFWLNFEKRLVPQNYDSDNGNSASDKD